MQPEIVETINNANRWKHYFYQLIKLNWNYLSRLFLAKSQFPLISQTTYVCVCVSFSRTRYCWVTITSYTILIEIQLTICTSVIVKETSAMTSEAFSYGTFESSLSLLPKRWYLRTPLMGETKQFRSWAQDDAGSLLFEGSLMPSWKTQQNIIEKKINNVRKRNGIDL